MMKRLLLSLLCSMFLILPTSFASDKITYSHTVHVSIDQLEISGDNAEWDSEENLLVVNGQSTLKKGQVSCKAQQISVKEKSGIVKLKGKVDFKDHIVQIHADECRFLHWMGKATFSGNVVYSGADGKKTCGKLEYDLLRHMVTMAE